MGSNFKHRLTSETLFRLITEIYPNDDIRSSYHNGEILSTSQLNDYTNGNNSSSLSESDLRRLWSLLSQMIRSRLLKHEPCLLPELGAFVIIDHPHTDGTNIQIKEPFFVLDTTFARRHRLSRIKKPNLSSALSLSLQANGNSTHIEPNTTLSSFNMQTIDYASLQQESGLTREQLMTAIAQLFAVIDKEVHPHGRCDLEFQGLGHFRILFGLGVFEFSDAFLAEFRATLVNNPSID